MDDRCIKLPLNLRLKVICGHGYKRVYILMQPSKWNFLGGFLPLDLKRFVFFIYFSQQPAILTGYYFYTRSLCFFLSFHLNKLS